MIRSFQRSFVLALGVALLLCLPATAGMAQRRDVRNIDRKKLNEARGEARGAAEVLREVMSVPLKAIPRELLERAEAVAVFPNVIKAAFIIGGRGGDGVISRRTPTGWSAPAFFNIGGASYGVQIGAQSTDYVMLFMNEGALKGLLEDKFEFGGEVSIAAGPVGRTASASTNLTLDAGILSYSRTKGLFAGASLQGAVVAPDNDLNEALYGMKARELLMSGAVSMSRAPSVVRIFPQTLARYSPGRPVSQTSRSNAPETRMQNTSGRGTRDEMRMQNTGMSGERNTRRSQNTDRPVARLSREVRNELLTLPYYGVFDWLEASVNADGTVTLRGQVVRATTKERAEAYVKYVEGVTRVANQIEVLPASINDDRLREALYRAIYSGPLFRYQVGSLNTIHIIVENGRATLKGSVNSEADKQIAYTQARTVNGLFGVNNQLVVTGTHERR